ncbi:DUF2254 domain-containing protein [Myxococcota bacterium]|nr:DUF2254 domain-containing protein [Myxococcota bacterium]MCZ7620698.1 DUF2254 domain-containing protein [Myxococcota bacterium]
MRTWITNRWHALRATFWFVPTLFGAGAVLLALTALDADARLVRAGLSADWLFAGSPEAARAVLIMLAGSMLGIAGVTFSITIVALSLTSAQFGPRLLRNFLRDPGNQIALGAFVATFLYCLLVLQRVFEARPVPAVAVSGAIALSVTNLGILIYFFHHISTSIQASSVVAGVARDLEAAIDRLCARIDPTPRATSDRQPKTRLSGGDAAPSGLSGYVQAVDCEHLLRVAVERDVVIEALYRAGDFVQVDAALIRTEPAGRLDDGDCDGIRHAFLLGRQPTEEQDLEYSVRQLVEVALRALSPGINDPFTAMTCIDWLGAALARLAAGGLPSGERYDEAGRVRLLLDALTFEGVADAALQQIRQAGVAHVAVSIRLLDTLAAIAPKARTRGQVEALRSHADDVLAGALAAAPIDTDRAALRTRHAEARRALDVNSGACDAA